MCSMRACFCLTCSPDHSGVYSAGESTGGSVTLTGIRKPDAFLKGAMYDLIPGVVTCSRHSDAQRIA